jgi:SAM-dependent methyltransferase
MTVGEPSAWVQRFSPLVPAGGVVLDVACGAGRHVRWFLERGHPVVALDRDLSRLGDDLQQDSRVEFLQADLEDGSPFPLHGRRFAAVVVVNYLYRPILPDLVAAVDEGGLLLYETFARGQERFGRPQNPDFLLAPGELLEAVGGRLRVLAYEDLIVGEQPPAARQRIAARRDPDQTCPARR